MRTPPDPSSRDPITPPPESLTESLESEWPHPTGAWTLELGSPYGSVTRTLEPGARLTLGSGRNVDVRVADRAVSAAHVRLTATNLGVRVEDMGSRNGLFVGHARVESVLLPATPTAFVIGRTTVSVKPRTDDDDVTDVESLPDVIGTSAAMRRLAREVRRHASHRVSILLHGASGTGKDVVARAIHVLSRRRGAFVPVNVGAIAESLADAELFGHRRGAFTGAIAARAGAFEAADRGTLFFDEIAELPPSLQVKLLRVVEDRVVRPIGSMEPVQVDVRFVAASWVDLAERVQQGRFREDLYHRMARVVIELPPLRQRQSDIPALARALLARMEPDVGPKCLSSAALAKLVAYGWPGNVRELDSVLYRAAAASDGIAIGPHHIELSLARARRTVGRAMGPREARELLAAHGGNQTAAARAAGVPRSTFRAWLDRRER